MNALKNLYENLMERLKAAIAEQQESELYISTKERFEALSPLYQKLIIGGVVLFVVFLFLMWPVSDFLDSMDLNGRFNERRQALKDLLRIERDLASGPNVPVPPEPSVAKNVFDAKIAGSGIKPDQIKEQSEIPVQKVAGTDQKGLHYKISHLTIRQATDLAYEFEHSDPGYKLGGLELLAEQQDPHFYEVGLTVVTFAPKVAEVAAPGKGIVDAIKKKTQTQEKSEDKIE